MMKRMKVILALMCICLGLSITKNVSAENRYVYDDADLLSIEEEQQLQDYASTMKEIWEMNFMVVTTADAEGKSSQEYADDFYDTHFTSSEDEDGVLYLIDLDNREIYLSTSGMAIRYLTDRRVENVLDEAYAYVAAGDYFGTFQAFFDASESYFYEGIPKDQYNYDTETGQVDKYQEPMKLTMGELLIAFAGALIPALLTVGIIKAKYQLKFEDFHYNENTDSDVTLSVKSDRLVNQFITHRRIPKNDGNSARSVGSSASRSSVHRSSGGRSHGGGGRRF